MVATDALMIVTCLILVEGVRGEIQHTVVKTLVTQDQFIRLCLLLGSLTLRLRYEHLVVQITLVDNPQVEETEHEDACDGIHLLQFAVVEEQQDGRTHQNNPERTQTVAGEHRLTHLRQVRHQRSHMLCRQTLQCIHLIGGDETVEEHRREECHQQTYTACENEARQQRLHHLRVLHTLCEHLS